MDAFLSPSRTVTVGTFEYRLDGSFATLRAIQEAFAEDVVQLLIRVMDMRVDELARLIALASGSPSSRDEIGQRIVDEIGGMSAEYGKLKTEIFAWLNIAITPKAEREKKSEEMRLILDRLNFRGPTTSASPSGASAGSPESFGEATSGN